MRRNRGADENGGLGAQFAAEGLRSALLRWFSGAGRDLPWRRERSVYRTVVSEFMCQQTQIDTVLPYFARWMERLPDFNALAAADEALVLKLWEGLGYYSRARNLHRLAQAHESAHPKPRSAAEWVRMPGVGRYTAAAIASIAFGEPVAVVDGNVVRVLSRLQAHDKPFANSGKAVDWAQPLADALLNPAAPGDHNEAVMELGATICTKRKPRCGACPLQQWCGAYRAGNPEGIPEIARPKTRQVRRPHILSIVDGRILLQRASRGSRRLADLHELPMADPNRITPAIEHMETRSRGIANERIAEELFQFTDPVTAEAAMLSPAEAVWVGLSELEAIVLSGPHRKWIRDLLSRQP